MSQERMEGGNKSKSPQTVNKQQFRFNRQPSLQNKLVEVPDDPILIAQRLQKESEDA